MFRHGGIFSVILFMLIAAVAAVAETNRMAPVPGANGLISGRIMIDGTVPMPGGIAAFFDTRSEYPPKFGNLRRIPDHVARVGPDGDFTVELPAGNYFLGVIVRNDPGATGPPGHEEQGFAAVDGEGRRKIFATAGGGAAVDLGDIHVSTAKDDWKFTDYVTVRGTLVDKNGQPFAKGAWILVRQNPAARRPNFISEKIQGNGQFELHLPPGRPYYLVAKDVPGMGRPLPGRHVGAYTGADPVFDQNKPEPKPFPLSGGAGEIVSGIQILMIEVPDAGAQTESMQIKPDNRKPMREIPGSSPTP